jgi:transposase
MPARNSADSLAPRTALCNNRSLYLRRPLPPLACAREHLEPLHTPAHRIITRDYHSSRASPKIRTRNIGDVRLARKVEPEHRLQMKSQHSLKKSPVKAPAERVLKDIRRQTRRHFSAEDKIRIVLDGLRGEDSIAELCRKEGIAQSLYYTWSKEFMEAGKRRLAGDTARAATSGEVQDLRREARALKECVADLTLENRLLKKSIIADGGDDE